MKHGSHFNNLTGKIFDRLQVIQFYGIAKNGKARWECLCICGNKIVVVGSQLVEGKTRSCGCLQREVAKRLVINMNSTHGMTNTRLFRIWSGMKTRCLNPKSKDYPNYGGRGITICERWLESFENFKEDMYESYLKHVEEFGEKDTSIERIEVMGNYDPANCQWATIKEQNRNTRVTAKSENFDEHKHWNRVLMSNLNHMLFENYKKSKYEKDFGCSIKELKIHLESQFLEDMTWSNHGNGPGKWTIDHIEPVSKFDLSKETDRLKCFYYTNLRPLWWEDNIKRSKLGYND
jgi:hypothetical protein